MRKVQEIVATKREKCSPVSYFKFVGIDDPLINVQRVANRVSKGGHGVPTEKIINRYNRTMKMLFEAATTADEALIFDNTDSDKGIQFSANVKNGNLELHEPTTPWISKFLVQKFNKK